MNGEEQPLWVFRLASGLAARLAPLSLILFVGSSASIGGRLAVGDFVLAAVTATGVTSQPEFPSCRRCRLRAS